MVDVDELGFDRTVAHASAGLHLHEIALGDVLMIARLGLDERQRKRRADDRRARKLAREVRYAADMIFVSVRDQQRPQLVRPFADVRKVVDDDVHPEHLVVGEH